MNARAFPTQRGMTLIELIVTITVVAMAGAALIGTLSFLAGTSGEQQRQVQAQSIANAYLQEILALSFADPDGVAEGANRALWDNVADYNGLDTPAASDKAGNAAGPFRVRVTTVNGGLTALPNNAVLRVDVRVDYDTSSYALATGFRTNHP